MSRTTRNTQHKKWQSKDEKADRKVYYHIFRAKVKQLIHAEAYDDIPRFRKTCGWLSH